MNLPARFSIKEKNMGGLTTRALAIIFFGFVAGGAIALLAPVNVFFRIMLFAGIFLTSVVFALWKKDRVYTTEEYIAQKVAYNKRPKFYRKGGAPDIETRRHYERNDIDTAEQNKAVREKVVFHLPSWLTPGSNEELVMQALSIFIFTGVAGWIGTGGVRDLQIFFNSLNIAIQ